MSSGSKKSGVRSGWRTWCYKEHAYIDVENMLLRFIIKMRPTIFVLFGGFKVNTHGAATDSVEVVFATFVSQ